MSWHLIHSAPHHTYQTYFNRINQRRFRHYAHALQVDNISIYQLGLTKRLVFLMYLCTDAATAKPAASFKV